MGPYSRRRRASQRPGKFLITSRVLTQVFQSSTMLTFRFSTRFIFFGWLDYGGPLTSLYKLTYVTLLHIFVFLRKPVRDVAVRYRQAMGGVSRSFCRNAGPEHDCLRKLGDNLGDLLVATIAASSRDNVVAISDYSCRDNHVFCRSSFIGFGATRSVSHSRLASLHYLVYHGHRLATLAAPLFGFAYLNFHMPFISRIREAGRHLVLFVIGDSFLSRIGYNLLPTIFQEYKQNYKARQLLVPVVLITGFVTVILWEILHNGLTEAGQFLQSSATVWMFALAPLLFIIDLIWKSPGREKVAPASLTSRKILRTH